jgi:hypothetical protein
VCTYQTEHKHNLCSRRGWCLRVLPKPGRNCLPSSAFPIRLSFAYLPPSSQFCEYFSSTLSTYGLKQAAAMIAKEESPDKHSVALDLGRDQFRIEGAYLLVLVPRIIEAHCQKRSLHGQRRRKILRSGCGMEQPCHQSSYICNIPDVSGVSQRQGTTPTNTDGSLGFLGTTYLDQESNTMTLWL